MNPLNPQHKRILVIDGGGFRGLGCLLVIDHITKAASARARKVLRPCDIFDLICGTSTGGLLAILLGRLRLDIGTATEIYKQLSTPLAGVSEPNFWETILSQELVASSGYEKAIADVIAEHSGSSELSLIVDAESSDSGPHANVRRMIVESCTH
ncbi:hypothetical protein BDQ12DRAFT_148893 [Crucibulum laeve]|uniref:PNPLA domain-containing protein n=1 Tax=Crucibulum laeve TaxID=68775 RepID=A0A5C3LZU0_9AGAR|nr:hypothetical protein BDQ12DRAFT_148893 [Crucibulum laeve]